MTKKSYDACSSTATYVFNCKVQLAKRTQFHYARLWSVKSSSVAHRLRNPGLGPRFWGPPNFGSKDNSQNFCKQLCSICIFVLVQSTFFTMPLTKYLYRTGTWPNCGSRVVCGSSNLCMRLFELFEKLYISFFNFFSIAKCRNMVKRYRGS